ncbi:MAG TPA: dTMP kinase [Phycisphaeraceae bacterium]|nr:dTMP kinase [Phycisphaeraceae bacterium]
METALVSEWIQKLRGRFLVFDGPDGSGKSTQFHRFAAHCRERGVQVCEVREPGGTSIGEQIRDILLDRNNTEMDLMAEMMLYMASRAQLAAQRIRPALARGELVLADRFISSTLAYQGTAGGLSKEDILTVGHVALKHAWPDLVIIFDVDAATAATRLNPLLDRMEAKGAAFHARVRQGFLDQASDDPEKHLLIDARSDEDTVWQELLTRLGEYVNRG